MIKWPQVKLGEILRRRKDEVIAQPLESYKRLTIRMNGQGIVIRDIVQGNEIGTKRQFKTKAVQLVLSKIDARNGAFGVLPADCDGAIITGNFWAFDPDENRLDVRYLNYLTKTPLFVEFCIRASEGTTNRRYLQEPKFLAQEIPLPPLDEQRRIVSRIEQLAAKIEEARNLRQQALEESEAFLRSSVSALYQDGALWGTVQDTVKKDKGSVRSGPFGSQLLHEEFVDSGVVAIGNRDVQTNRFELRGGWFVTQEKFEEFRRYQVFPNDVLCTIVGGSIGRFCVVPENVPLAFTTKHIQALTLDEKKTDPRFVCYMLNFNHRCRESLFSKVEGSAQPSLNAGKILSTQLPLPTVSEQRSIVAYLDDLQAKVDALKQMQTETAEELDALMPSILSKAFSGEL